MKKLIVFCICGLSLTFLFSQSSFQLSGEVGAAIAISNCSVEHDASIKGYTYSPAFNAALGVRKSISSNKSIELLLNGYYVNYKHKSSDEHFFFPSQGADYSNPAKEYNYADIVYLGPTLGMYFDRPAFTWFTSVGIHAAVYNRSNLYYYADGELVDQNLNTDFKGRAPLRSQAKLGVLLGKANSRLPQIKIFYAFDFVPQYENSTIKSTYSSLGIGFSF